MNLVKRYLFWIVIGVFLVGSVAFWVLGVLLKQGEVSAKETQFASIKGQVEQWAGPKLDTIRNANDVEAIKEYREKLQNTENKVEAEFTAVNINIESSRWPQQPPVNDLALFRRWIQQQYRERDQGVAQLNKEMTIARDPEDPARTGDYSLNDLSLENIPLALKRLVISSEIYRILASARAEVTTLERDVEGTGDERMTRSVRTVDQLNELRFFDTPEQAATERAKRAGRMARGTTAPEAPEGPFARPYQKHVFFLEFVAHYSLVPGIMKRILDSNQMFVTFSRMDIYRHPASTPEMLTQERGRFGLSADNKSAYYLTKEQRRLLNSRYQEGPVVVLLECEVLEFDFPENEEDAK